MDVIFGGNGGIGQHISRHIPMRALYAPTSTTCDVRDPHVVRYVLKTEKPKLLFFCAGIMSNDLLESIRVNVMPLQTIHEHYEICGEPRPSCVVLSSTCRCSSKYPEYAASMAARSAYALSTDWMQVLEIGGCRTALRARAHGPEPGVRLLDPVDVAASMIRLAGSKVTSYCVMEAPRNA
jgi:hypothetical protein